MATQNRKIVPEAKFVQTSNSYCNTGEQIFLSCCCQHFLTVSGYVPSCFLIKRKLYFLCPLHPLPPSSKVHWQKHQWSQGPTNNLVGPRGAVLIIQEYTVFQLNYSSLSNYSNSPFFPLGFLTAL